MPYGSQVLRSPLDGKKRRPQDDMRWAERLLLINEGMRNTVGKEISVWYDKEGDYLEVIFERKAGYFRETENDAIMEKVDNEGNIVGFSILKVSGLKEQKPLSVTLK